MRTTFRITLLLVIGLGGHAYAQSLSLLSYPTSARSLAMGGVGTAYVSDNAAATVDNPAQLGMFSLDGLLNANTDFHDLTGSGLFHPDIPFGVNALNAGTTLARFWKGLPFKGAVGIGYSNLAGTTSIRSLDGGPTVSFNETDISNAVSLGFGFDYLVRVGLGFSFKWVSQHYEFAPPTSIGEDIGAIVQIPVNRLIAGTQRNSTQSGAVIPLYSATIGYAMRNLSGYRWGTPELPTTADLGWSIDAGLESRVGRRKWEWLSFAWSEQAGDSPFYSDSSIWSITGSDTTWNYVSRYQKGLGHFGIWRNLIVGKGSQAVGIRRGGQIGLGEFLYVRAGAITDAGQTTYTTFGWGLRLDGLTKCLVFLGWVNPNAPAAKFLLDHLDLQYDYSRAYGGVYRGKPFEDLNLVVR